MSRINLNENEAEKSFVKFKKTDVYKKAKTLLTYVKGETFANLAEWVYCYVQEFPLEDTDRFLMASFSGYCMGCYIGALFDEININQTTSNTRQEQFKEILKDIVQKLEKAETENAK